jgi:NADPH-dependent 2,4-dienoyl-CoA reductase/sulfur reductase-like enzyme
MARTAVTHSANSINEANGPDSTMQSTAAINGTNGIAHSANSINGVNGLNGDHGLADHVYPPEGTNPVETPVLLVGGGPTGLLLAHLLSRLGGKRSDFDTSS